MNRGISHKQFVLFTLRMDGIGFRRAGTGIVEGEMMEATPVLIELCPGTMTCQPVCDIWLHFLPGGHRVTIASVLLAEVAGSRSGAMNTANRITREHREKLAEFAVDCFARFGEGELSTPFPLDVVLRTVDA